MDLLSNSPPPAYSSMETGSSLHLPAYSSMEIWETRSSSPMVQLVNTFTIDEIRSATQDFNESLIIGEGGFGNVYKGTLKNGRKTIAVKRRKSDSSQGFQQFQAEVDLLPMLRHPNIVCLIGYCNHDQEMIIVYEYISNGSLGDHLHNLRTPLSWSQRLNICIDVANALDYLHKGTSGQEVIHRNLTSSDILLDNQWAAKIAGFGLSKIIPVYNPSIHVITSVEGTIGYIDPEYLATGRLSNKSDVYSFGVLLLEVLCRRRAVDTNLDEEQQALVRWAQDCMRTGKLEQIIDPDVKGQISYNCLNDYARIVRCCLHERQEPRITMNEVLFGLESILALHKMTIPQMGIDTYDWGFHKHFSSSTENSGKKPAPDVKERRGIYKRRKTIDSMEIKCATTEDNYSWRKYGQKAILNSKFPRCYYRCTHQLSYRCKALKRVQKLEDESNMFRIRYFGHHTCPTPKNFSHSGVVLDIKDSKNHYSLSNSPSTFTNIQVQSSLKQEVDSKAQSTDASDNMSSVNDGHSSPEALGWNEIWHNHVGTGHEGAPFMWPFDHRMDIELLSAKSDQNEGDYGDMPETDMDVISEKSFKQFEISSPPSIVDFSEDYSEPNHKVVGDQSKSLYELMHAECILVADNLIRMKDFLHLIWFYPVEKEAEVNFRSLLDKFSSLNEYIRKSLDSPRDGSYLIEIQTLLKDIDEHVDAAAFDVVAYLPEDNRSVSVGHENLATGANSGQVSIARFWSGIPEVHASAFASAAHRAVSCINDLKVKKLGISGSGSQEVAETLKGMPELRSAFDMVLCVRVKHHGIEELMNDIEEEIHLWRKRSSETDKETIVVEQLLNCLLFVDCSDDSFDLHGLEFNLSKWFGTVQIVLTSGSQNVCYMVDMEIRVQDHLLPWLLFSTNVDLETVGKYSRIQEMATRLIEKCHGHLLAIILLARNLRGVVDDGVWEFALQELASQKEPSSSSQLGVTSDVMVRVLRFIWSRMESVSRRCIIQFASRYRGTELDKFSLINSWIRDGLVKTEQEGEYVFEDLIRSFLLEQVGNNCVRMRDETRVILVAEFVPRAYGLYLKEDGSESTRMPNIKEWDAREIHLSNNIISELPDNPNCPILLNLFLHFNRDLMDIPITFFNNMPGLQSLDLSNTSIKCLPSSISKLTTLRKLFIRDCDLLMELPPEIGALKNLKVFDSEGTQLICLPEQFGLLTKLECLKFSLYNFADMHKRSNQSILIVPASVLSKLTRLKELSICVDSYGKWWEDEVKFIISFLPKVRNLEYLRLYFPTTELLKIFMVTQNGRAQRLSNFGFIVGHLQQRMISRIQRDLHKAFVELPKCLTYTNGEGDTEVIGTALEHANALFLDRHWTVQSLSAFGLAKIEKLKFCLLAECNEMVEIVNGSFLKDYPLTFVLGSLEHLSIHYMKSLTCILNRPIDSVCLPNLKTLAIHTCPELRTIFTQGLLESLTCLEYLIVKDCTTIKSLVSSESYRSTSTPCLPSLKKISLLQLPELVSISGGISIAPRLERMVVYDCPNLKKLPYMEASDHICEIKGENEWWDALKWCEPEWTTGQPDYLARVFIPLGTDGNIMHELADAVNLLPHLSN